MSTTRYTEDEMLMLSGIQHFAFCPRQWWLIHVDQAWAENCLTALGQQMHQRVNDPNESERRGITITLRAMPIASTTLGLYGVADAVELRPTSSEEGFTHPRYPGYWHPTPIEYKRCAPKRYTRADQLQLCRGHLPRRDVQCTHSFRLPLLWGNETSIRSRINLRPPSRNS